MTGDDGGRSRGHCCPIKRIGRFAGDGVADASSRSDEPVARLRNEVRRGCPHADRALGHCRPIKGITPGGSDAPTVRLAGVVQPGSGGSACGRCSATFQVVGSWAVVHPSHAVGSLAVACASLIGRQWSGPRLGASSASRRESWCRATSRDFPRLLCCCVATVRPWLPRVSSRDL